MGLSTRHRSLPNSLAKYFRDALIRLPVSGRLGSGELMANPPGLFCTYNRGDAPMRTLAKSLTAAGAATALCAASIGLAYADQVRNGIDGTADAIAEILPLTVGTDGGTTLYYIETSDD